MKSSIYIFSSLDLTSPSKLDEGVFSGINFAIGAWLLFLTDILDGVLTTTLQANVGKSLHIFWPSTKASQVVVLFSSKLMSGAFSQCFIKVNLISMELTKSEVTMEKFTVYGSKTPNGSNTKHFLTHNHILYNRT